MHGPPRQVDYGNEFFMVNRAFKAIRRADIVFLLVDVEAGITDQVSLKYQGWNCVIMLGDPAVHALGVQIVPGTRGRRPRKARNPRVVWKAFLLASFSLMQACGFFSTYRLSWSLQGVKVGGRTLERDACNAILLVFVLECSRRRLYDFPGGNHTMLLVFWSEEIPSCQKCPTPASTS